MKKTLLASACLMGMAACQMANALSVTSYTVGGVPTGSNLKYFTFNDISLPGLGPWTSYSTDNLSSVEVTANPDGKAVTGSNVQYAPPNLSGGQGANFGGQADGADTTVYLTSGKTGNNGSVQLEFGTAQKYLGLLWGSVDKYNTLSFYLGNTFVGSISGSQASVLANGDQGPAGTYYVNINAGVGETFDKVVATSTDYAFEFDNVAISTENVSVPDGGSTLALLGGALGALGFLARRRS